MSTAYHVSVDKMYYSVPFEYIKQQVDVRLTRNVIEVFIGGNRICSHPRLHGRTGQYSTLEAHMPEEHQSYINWDADRFIAWAKKIGPNAEITIRSILNAHKVQQQGFRSCMGASGAGKSYIACALGMEACKQFYSVKYIRLPELLADLAIARGEGSIKKLLGQYRKYDLLIRTNGCLYH